MENTKSRLLTFEEIEPLPGEEFDTLPEEEKRSYFSRRNRETLLKLANIPCLWRELKRADYEGQARELPLGQVVCTEKALANLEQADIDSAIARHASGDWGELDYYDWIGSDCSLQQGEEVLSLYRSRLGKDFYVITDANRALTTVMMVAEFY